MLGVLILLAGAPSASMPLLDGRTARPIDAFGACFTQFADRGSRAWAWLPTGRGGTFTDSGARGAPASYWLELSEAGKATHLRLFTSASPAAASGIVQAVDKCR